MAGKLPRAFIDEVLTRTDIVSVIDGHVSLRKKGVNYLACCPFHQEKTPSFCVSPDKQIYHCFGCGASGNAISFLIEYERLNFIEAVSVLAKTAGLAMPEADAGHMPASNALYDLMQRAADYYAQQLRKHKPAIEYFKARGLSGQIAKEFQLGYAPDGWDNLLPVVGGRHKADLVTVGLGIAKAPGKSYDRFRDRVMFPIRDRRGRVIGFGGRIIDKGEPKYLNSPETPLFHKGRELYGLYEARKACRDLEFVVVVEGYMDVLALVQHEIRQVVGTLGTATTSEQINQLLKVTHKIIFCFDGDEAGKEAGWRALQVALASVGDGATLQFVFLPDGEDPDSYIRDHGKAEFLDLLKRAMSFSDFFFNKLTAKVNLSSLDGKAQLTNLAIPLLQKMPESNLKQMMFERLAQLTHLTSRQLQKNAVAGPVVFSKKVNVDVLTPMRLCLALLLQNPQLQKIIPEEVNLARWQFEGGQLLAEIVFMIANNPEITGAELMENYRDQAEYNLLAQLMVREHHIEMETQEQAFRDLMLRLQRDYVGMVVDGFIRKAKEQGLSDQEKKELQQYISILKT